jgi:large subunit ribosomal protein L31e
MAEKKSENKEENKEVVLTVNLRRAYDKPRTKRLKAAIKELRKAIARFTKSEVVKISQKVNEMFFKRSVNKPPRRIRVKVVKKGTTAYVENL